MSRESKNGYDFYMDMLARVRKVHGQLFLGPTTARSRFNQIQAGKPDRRSGDDRGHFIAARFTVPNDSFNHFPQDANFNRSASKALENSWANDLRAGRSEEHTSEHQALMSNENAACLQNTKKRSNT